MGFRWPFVRRSTLDKALADAVMVRSLGEQLLSERDDFKAQFARLRAHFDATVKAKDAAYDRIRSDMHGMATEALALTAERDGAMAELALYRNAIADAAAVAPLDVMTIDVLAAGMGVSSTPTEPYA